MFISATIFNVTTSVAIVFVFSVLFDAIVKDVIVGGIAATSEVVVTVLGCPVSKIRI